MSRHWHVLLARPKKSGTGFRPLIRDWEIPTTSADGIQGPGCSRHESPASARRWARANEIAPGLGLVFECQMGEHCPDPEPYPAEQRLDDGYTKRHRRRAGDYTARRVEHYPAE